MSIATDLLRPHMERYLASMDEYDPDDEASLSPIAILAIRADVDEETIRRIVNGKISRVVFNTADKIICAMGDATIWYGFGKVTHESLTTTGENGFAFRDVYWQEKLPTKGDGRGGFVTEKKTKRGGSRICAARGCDTSFVIPKQGGKIKLYCSLDCKHRAHAQRRSGPGGSRENEGRYSNPMDTCVNGHDWNEVNTYIHPKSGKRWCKRCRADQARNRRAGL